MHADTEWLDCRRIASVTARSASGAAPLRPGAWVADVEGEQTVTVRFHQPIAVRRLRLVFEAAHDDRTQEFSIWASLHRGERHVAIVRQQFNFSPHGATREVEEYATDLDDVSTLEIRLVPSIDGRPATARLTDFRVASHA